MINRREFIKYLGAAPAIVAARNIMPVIALPTKKLILPSQEIVVSNGGLLLPNEVASQMILRIKEGNKYRTIAAVDRSTLTQNNPMEMIGDYGPVEAGLVSVDFSGVGRFKDQNLLRDKCIARTLDRYQIVTANGECYEGDFQVQSVEHAGDLSGEMAVEFELGSSGPITFSVK